jgi:hypothetical protein
MKPAVKAGWVPGRSVVRTPLGAAVIALLTCGVTAGPVEARTVPHEIQTLDGSHNNIAHPGWGRAGTDYSRVAPARYADGHSEPVGGPGARYLSNRVFSDEVKDDKQRDFAVNIFSEHQVSQWGWVWGQFLDHTFGLREGELPSDPHGEPAPIPVPGSDPMEHVSGNGKIPFVRSAPAPGTGVTNARQQVNLESSYIDAAGVYGSDDKRLEWLREGPVDGDLRNNGAKLLLPGAYLPRRDARGSSADAPEMALDGAIKPEVAAVAGDPRANNNIAVTAIQTLFAREHNRIVDRLPKSLTEEQRFQIARRVVIAEMQYVTYHEFLPAMGVDLPAYRGYRPGVDASLSTEFATAGYRVHSMVHSGLPVTAPAAAYTPDELKALEDQGIHLDYSDDHQWVSMEIPLTIARDNPELVKQLRLGPLLAGVGRKAQYKNDEDIDTELRDVLCSPPTDDPKCVSDLSATVSSTATRARRSTRSCGRTGSTTATAWTTSSPPTPASRACRAMCSSSTGRSRQRPAG